ncbi:hypothetical protein KLP40_17695 [Hymenobacter sp. NST-14]|uniref:hypothetical protein n=1 Tax=Hymenobacter piscis TaxID=2839984 RepID=UPI001C00F8D1|nr:hypothetical protein [Hymenobacter piscis]MBT9395004.1 hypothetical protein [Hymenobacter piscis]
MLTRRTLSLIFAALLTGYSAAAQTAPAAAGPQGTDVLSWAVWWVAGLALLMAIITGSSIASAAQRYGAEVAAEETPAPRAAEPVAAAARPLAPQARPVAAPVECVAA